MDTDSTRFALVALPVPLRMAFTYRVPPDLDPWVVPGAAVEVRLRAKRETGFVVERTGRPAGLADAALRDVLDVRSATPVIGPQAMEFLRWAADYYLEPLGEVLRAAVPPGLFSDRNFFVRASGGPAGKAGAVPEGVARDDALKVLAFVAGRPARISQVVSKSGARRPRLACALLEKAGLVVVDAGGPPSASKRIVRLAAEPSADVLAALYRRSQRTAELLDLLIFRGEIPLGEVQTRFKGAAEKVKRLCEMGLAVEAVADDSRAAPPGTQPALPFVDLSPAQGGALGTITQALGRGYASFLLHGVTGSGKTEVYLRAAEKVLKAGRSVLMLVPEISLTPQLAARTRARFPADVAVLHSGLREQDRLAAWLDARAGRRRVVLGARSAVFAPLDDVGLVIVDEEHEGAYKQDESPRYHGRDLAIKRAQMAGAVVVLGSATPSIESYHNTVAGKSVLLTLPDRVTGHPLPEVETVDLGLRKREMRNRKAGDRRLETAGQPSTVSHQPSAPGLQPDVPDLPFFMTHELLAALEATAAAGRQSILLLNRRGFASFVVCRECGHQFLCDQCSVSMTYHRTRRAFICHYCGRFTPLPEQCPACWSQRLEMLGLGTERVEDEVRRRLPGVRLLRLDRDVAHDFTEVERILESFASGGADVLVGTQMVAKGHHFPNVTFVGIVIADIGLSIPDFRAGERLFGLLSQVAGRSGRGAEPGTVLIQTFNPDHYAVASAKAHDYAAFYGREIEARRELLYPPFARLVRLVFDSVRKEKAIETSDGFAQDLTAASGRGVQVLGPAPAVIDRMRGSYRYQLLVRGRSLGQAKKAIDAMLRPGGKWHRIVGVRVTVDVDPIGML